MDYKDLKSTENNLQGNNKQENPTDKDVVPNAECNISCFTFQLKLLQDNYKDLKILKDGHNSYDKNHFLYAPLEKWFRDYCKPTEENIKEYQIGTGEVFPIGANLRNFGTYICHLFNKYLSEQGIKQFKMTRESFKELKTPCIAGVDMKGAFKHFINIMSYNGKELIVNDPFVWGFSKNNGSLEKYTLGVEVEK